MIAPLLISMPDNERMTAGVADALGAETGHLEMRKFPDGETYLRFATNPAGRPVSIVCTLADLDAKILSLIFAAATARELGASKVGLISPYLAYMRQDRLAYMRQDRRFNPGEAVTSPPACQARGGVRAAGQRRQVLCQPQADAARVRRVVGGQD
jgi:ribose-phosphate pyrophosphokinase